MIIRASYVQVQLIVLRPSRVFVVLVAELLTRDNRVESSRVESSQQLYRLITLAINPLNLF